MLDYAKIPVAYMAIPLVAYMECGHPPSSFLAALLSNDLMETFRRADESNRAAVFEWCQWLHNEAPPGSFGSVQAVTEWMRDRQAQTAKEAAP